MPKNPNPIGRFWQELRRRKVLSVLAMYAGAAFVIIELINNVADPLGIPSWVPTVVILILIIGFPVAAVLSWLFDITPEGVKLTESLEGTDQDQNLPETSRRKLRPSDVVIAVLVIVVGILVYPKIFAGDDFKGIRDSDGKIAIAVLPFENLSGDTLFDIWQGGFQNLLISTLTNSEELAVRKYQAVNEVLSKEKDLRLGSLSPSLVNVLSEKLDTRTLIMGNILKAGTMIRINAQLVDVETEEIYKTYQVDGNSENDLFELADSLAGMIKNYIEIKNISEQYNSPEIRAISMTHSSEAFKNFIRGWDAFKYEELESSIEWFSEAIKHDSNYTNAYIFLSYSLLMAGNDRQAKYWCEQAYKNIENAPLAEKLALDQLNAYFYETPLEEIKYLKQLLELDAENPQYWHMTAFAYYKLFEYEDAVKSWEQVFRIHERWGTDFKNPYAYFLMGDAYHKLNEHEKEKEILALGLKVYPHAIMIHQYQAICAFTRGEREKANEIIAEYKTIRHNVLHCTEAMISSGIGVIYSSAGMFEEAEDHYRQSIEQDPENLVWVRDFAWFLINNDINLEEGLEISEMILELYPEYWPSIDAKGWALYKLGKEEEALALLKDSWDLKPAYSHTGYLHIQEIEKALASQNKEL